jgi:hypothetical protein
MIRRALTALLTLLYRPWDWWLARQSDPWETD